MADIDDFEDVERTPREPFVIDVDGFEGPIDLLLSLARDQKVDLARISIVQLADQYLAFIARAREISIDLAADYLVMAAWLAYLKSRLLIPSVGTEEEPTGEEMAAALAFKLQRLEAIRKAGERLVARPRLGQDVFARGMSEPVEVEQKTVFEVTLYDLLRAYADNRRRRDATSLLIAPMPLYSLEEAMESLRRLVGATPEWSELWRFLPTGLRDPLVARSALATTFSACLELVKEGRIHMRQSGTFGPIHVRSAGREGGA